MECSLLLPNIAASVLRSKTRAIAAISEGGTGFSAIFFVVEKASANSIRRRTVPPQIAESNTCCSIDNEGNV